MLYTIASRSLDRLAAGYRRDVHDRRVRPCAVGRRPRVVRRRAVERPPLAGIGASNREHETMFGGFTWKTRKLRSSVCTRAVSYTHLRAHETRHDLVCRL